MKRTLVSGSIAVLVIAVLVMSLAGTVLADGPGTRWYLCDNSQYFVASNGAPSQYLMSENMLLAEGEVQIKEGVSVLWVADTAASVATSFPADEWSGNLAITDGPGACLVEIGKWAPGGALSFYGSVPIVFDGATVRDNPFTVYVGAFDLQVGERLACRITTTSRETLLHSGSSPDAYGQSWIQTPGNEPPPPVPELPTVVLLGIGLAGVAGVVGMSLLKHRSAA